MTNQTNRHSPCSKKIIDRLSLSIFAPGTPNLDRATPNFTNRKPVPDPEWRVKRFRFSGSESDDSPFRRARPYLASYSDSPKTTPHSTHFLLPTGVFGRIYRTKQFFSPARGCCSGRKPVRLGNSAQNYTWIPKYVRSGVSGTENQNMNLVFI